MASTSGLPLWNTIPQHLQNDLQQLLIQLQKSQQQNRNAQLDIARLIAQNAAAQWQDFLRGLWLYQHQTIQRIDSPWDIIAQHKAVALKRLKVVEKHKSKRPVYLIPSLINRFHILDLHPNHSFAKFFQEQGHDVYLIDWHHDITQPMPQSLEACITDYLQPFQAHIPHRHHLIGYCMGGTLGLAAAALNPKQIASLTLIATPWDFHQPDRQSALQFGTLLDQYSKTTPLDHIKAEWLQILFWQRDPLASLRKFQTFAHTIDQKRSAENFVLAEDWLNSGIDLPTALLQDCADSWFNHNKPVQHNWTIANRTIDLTKLDHMPIHLVAAERDKLVPAASSTAIQNFVPHAVTRVFDTGHIGLFAGAKSQTEVWPQVQQFLTDHNT